MTASPTQPGFDRRHRRTHRRSLRLAVLTATTWRRCRAPAGGGACATWPCCGSRCRPACRPTCSPPADRRGHELVAGGAHHLPGQSHRARADGAQRPRRHEVRHSVSRLLPGVVRHPRGQCAGAAAGARGLRLVRHSNLDRRLGDLQDSRRVRARHGETSRTLPGSASTRRNLACFLFFWAINMLVIYKGIESIRILLNIKAPLLIALGLVLLALGLVRGRRVRRDALEAVGVRGGRREGGRVLAVLLRRAHRQRRLLGHAVAQHPRLQPLRLLAARPGPRPGARACRRRWRCSRSSASPSRAPPPSSTARRSGIRSSC